MVSRNAVSSATKHKVCSIPSIFFLIEFFLLYVKLGCSFWVQVAVKVPTASIFVAKTSLWFFSGMDSATVMLVFPAFGLNFLLLLTRIASKELHVVCSRTRKPDSSSVPWAGSRQGSPFTAVCGLIPKYFFLPCSCLPTRAAIPGNNEAVILFEYNSHDMIRNQPPKSDFTPLPEGKNTHQQDSDSARCFKHVKIPLGFFLLWCWCGQG